jgi:dUTPase
MINFKIEGQEGILSIDPAVKEVHLEALKIIKVFRGDREIEPENLIRVQEGFNERGFIKLRSLERVLFGTGLTPVFDKSIQVQVISVNELVIQKGLAVLGSPSVLVPEEEISVLIYNSTPFLNKIEKGEIIAKLAVYNSNF